LDQLTNASLLPAQPFFSTPQQRLALARQRYFDEGVRPSGLVSENVIQSWSRCVQSRRDPVEHIAFNPVTPSRIHSALTRSETLLRAAASDLSQLETTLAGTSCTAILTDPLGVVVHATRSAADHGEVLIPLARRIGVALDEEHIGTGAPGVTLRTGQPSVVMGSEHFFGGLHILYCAAAPIRDVHGQIAAVLDVSSESRTFGFDAAAVVGLYATTIENRLLQAQSTEHTVVHLQTSPSLLDTPMEGLAGLDTNGGIAWVNNIGARLLGVSQGEPGLTVEAVFGVEMHRLVLLTRVGGASMHRLPNGLNVWMTARMHARDGIARSSSSSSATSAPRPTKHAAAAAPKSDDARLVGHAATTLSAAPSGTLRETDRQVIERTLQACAGNVSKAARTLGVSRGLIYRHLKGAGSSTP
jgi:sigma-54 dependent transcriptional regulator, acetoin dehydrogenase operon transcriptional activator AcoR